MGYIGTPSVAAVRHLAALAACVAVCMAAAPGAALGLEPQDLLVTANPPATYELEDSYLVGVSLTVTNVGDDNLVLLHDNFVLYTDLTHYGSAPLYFMDDGYGDRCDRARDRMSIGKRDSGSAVACFEVPGYALDRIEGMLYIDPGMPSVPLIDADISRHDWKRDIQVIPSPPGIRVDHRILHAGLADIDAYDLPRERHLVHAVLEVENTGAEEAVLRPDMLFLQNSGLGSHKSVAWDTEWRRDNHIPAGICDAGSVEVRIPPSESARIEACFAVPRGDPGLAAEIVYDPKNTAVPLHAVFFDAGDIGNIVMPAAPGNLELEPSGADAYPMDGSYAVLVKLAASNADSSAVTLSPEHLVLFDSENAWYRYSTGDFLQGRGAAIPDGRCPAGAEVRINPGLAMDVEACFEVPESVVGMISGVSYERPGTGWPVGASLEDVEVSMMDPVSADAPEPADTSPADDPGSADAPELEPAGTGPAGDPASGDAPGSADTEPADTGPADPEPAGDPVSADAPGLEPAGTGPAGDPASDDAPEQAVKGPADAADMPADADAGAPAPAGSGGGCLIATAAYGTELEPRVQALREMRQNVVMSTGSGASFMAWFNDVYYSFSPAVADLQREHPALREAARIALAPMLYSLDLVGLAEPGSEVQVAGLGIAVISLNAALYVAAPAATAWKIGRAISSKSF